MGVNKTRNTGHPASYSLLKNLSITLDIHGTAVVRKKISSFKSKIQAAEKRTERAKEGQRRPESCGGELQ